MNTHAFGAGDSKAAAIRKQRQAEATARLEAAKKKTRKA